MRLKQRAEFLHVAKGRRAHSAGLTLQAAERAAESGFDSARFGLTVTNKIGNSPQRNRIRRRLREVLRLTALPVQDACDYVIVGRVGLLTLPFSDIGRELVTALKRVHQPRSASPKSAKPKNHTPHTDPTGAS